MMHHLIRTAILASLFVGTGTWRLWAQSSINPDISVIPDFRIFSTDETNAPENGRLNMALEEVEAAIQAPLNPYARADIFLSFSTDPEEPAAIEEAYFTILKGLPLSMNIKGGRFLLDFSKLNTLHAHAYPFVERPLVHQAFIGDEGLKDEGIEVNTILPTGSVYARLSGTVATGDELDGGRKSLFGSSRLSTFFELSDETALETGVAASTGRTDVTGKRFMWYQGDAKYRWRRDQYTSLTVWGEGLMSRSDGLSTTGVVGAAAFQFKRRFEAGSKFDLTQSIDSKDRTRAVSAFFNFLPVEETLVFRLLLSNTKPAGAKSYNTVMLQTMFSLGPHKAHAF